MTKIKPVFNLFSYQQSLYQKLNRYFRMVFFSLCPIFFTIGLHAQAEISPQVKSLVSAYFVETDESPAVIAKKFSASIAKLNAASDTLQARKILAAYAETNYLYAEAADQYSQAALLETDPEAVFALNLKAARSYFLAGDSQLSAYILNTVIAQAADNAVKTQAEVYLLLAGLEDDANFNENRAALQRCIADAKYAGYMPTLLFALYWLTGDAQAKNRLVKEFPASMEAETVQNKATVSPVAFWYLMPRKNSAGSVSAKAEQTSNKNTAVTKTSAPPGTQKPLYYQVGFFKTKENADSLAAELVGKGFPAHVIAKTKNASTSFSVVVNESNGVSISEKLRNAGYECYPVFEK